jgi:hypothetical protein
VVARTPEPLVFSKYSLSSWVFIALLSVFQEALIYDPLYLGASELGAFGVGLTGAGFRLSAARLSRVSATILQIFQLNPGILKKQPDFLGPGLGTL